MAGVAAEEDAGDEPAWIEEVLKFESSKVLKLRGPRIVVIPNGIGICENAQIRECGREMRECLNARMREFGE